MEQLANPNDWNQPVESVRYSGLLQSWQWGEFRRSQSWQVDRLHIGGAYAQMLTKRIAPKLTMSYVPQGPAIDWALPDSAANFKELVSQMKAKAKLTDAFVIRIDPVVSSTHDVTIATKVLNNLKVVGFRKSFEEIQAAQTIYLDLTKSDDQLLANMHPKCRYNIRLAEKKEVSTKVVTLAEGVERFHKLYQTTYARDQFVGRPLEYFSKLADLLDSSGYGFMVEAWHGETHLSSLFITTFGERATYLYGASSNEGRELMPNHLAQWVAIQTARERGYKVYDFWGVAKTEDPKHHWAGFSRFKRQFGGEYVEYIGAYDLPTSAPKYHAYRLAQFGRKKILGLRGE